MSLAMDSMTFYINEIIVTGQQLSKVDSRMEMVLANSLKKCGCHLSCPGNLLGFSSFNFVQTVSGVISRVDKTSSNGMVGAMGIFCRSSIVKTLVKKLFNVSALSFAEVALEPFGVFNLDFAYFKSNFGFPFTLRAKLHSNSCLKFAQVRSYIVCRFTCRA